MSHFRAAALPPDERARLAALRELEILDSEVEQSFDDIANLASLICCTPISLISFIEEDRQWFKAVQGLDVKETSREVSFCAHAILGEELFVVEDATQDERFSDNPLVKGGLKIRFYAGAPVSSPDGYKMGALCVIDTVPHELTEIQKDALVRLARQANSHLAHRKAILSGIRRETQLGLKTERLEIVLKKGHLGIWDANLVTGELYLDEAWEKILDYEPGEIPRTVQAISDTAYHEDLPEVMRRFEAHIADPKIPFEVEFRAMRKHGGVIWVHSFAEVVERDSDGKAIRMVGLNQDITASKIAYAEYEELNGRFRAAVETMQEGIIVEGADGVFQLCNDSACRILGLSREQILGLTSLDESWHTVHEDMTPFPGEEHPAQVALRSGRPMRNTVMGVYRPDGELRWITINADPTFAPGAVKPKNVICTFADITDSIELRKMIDSQITSISDFNVQLELQQYELAEANALLEKIAVTDSLTELYNRGFFSHKISELVKAKGKNQQLFSLVMLDVDHFKKYNDTYGHIAGDEVLRNVAELLRASIRDVDFACRYGGEEFVLILSGAAEEASSQVAERVRETIQNFAWPLREVTVSVGVATQRGQYKDVDAMIVAADSALYASKHDGRNRVTRAEGLREAS